MKITIKVIPNAKQNSVEEVDYNYFKVKVTAPAVDGKANKAILKVLAAHFGVRKSAVDIVSGELSRQKVVEIDKK